MKTEIEALKKLFTGQLEAYEKLLRLSEKLIMVIDKSYDAQKIVSLMEERANAVAGIRETDSEISKMLDSPKRGEWLENHTVKSSIEAVLASAQRVKAMDDLLREKVEGTRGDIQKEFGSIAKTRKSIAGYGPVEKPAYAKFIDIKLK